VTKQKQLLMGLLPNVCIRRLKMAIVAIVHLHVVDVDFVLRSSGRTSQIQILSEQSQNRGLDCFESRASDTVIKCHGRFLTPAGACLLKRVQKCGCGGFKNGRCVGVRKSSAAVEVVAQNVCCDLTVRKL
jgi:hypothetical protein